MLIAWTLGIVTLVFAMHIPFTVSSDFDPGYPPLTIGWTLTCLNSVCPLSALDQLRLLPGASSIYQMSAIAMGECAAAETCKYPTVESKSPQGGGLRAETRCSLDSAP